MIRKAIRDRITIARYQFMHWLYRWTADSDGDITFTVAGFINFTKYKEHTVIKLQRGYRPAKKYVEKAAPRLDGYKPSDDPLEYHESFA